MRARYTRFGTFSILAGAVILVAPSILAGPSQPLTYHLLREEAAAFVFIGLMCFLAFRNAGARRSVHIALLVFTALFACVHWLEYVNTGQYLMSGVVNSLPSLILLVTLPRERATVGR